MRLLESATAVQNAHINRMIMIGFNLIKGTKCIAEDNLNCIRIFCNYGFQCYSKLTPVFMHYRHVNVHSTIVNSDFVD